MVVVVETGATAVVEDEDEDEPEPEPEPEVEVEEGVEVVGAEAEADDDEEGVEVVGAEAEADDDEEEEDEEVVLLATTVHSGPECCTASKCAVWTGLHPGRAERAPVTASSGSGLVMVTSWSVLTPPGRSGHLSAPVSPALQESIIACRVSVFQPEMKSMWRPNP